MEWTSVKDAYPSHTGFLWIAYLYKPGQVCYTCGIYTGCGTPHGNWIDEVGKRTKIKGEVTHWITMPHLPDDP